MLHAARNAFSLRLAELSAHIDLESTTSQPARPSHRQREMKMKWKNKNIRKCMSGCLIIKISVNIFASGKRKWSLPVCGDEGGDYYGEMAELVELLRPPPQLPAPLLPQWIKIIKIKQNYISFSVIWISGLAKKLIKFTFVKVKMGWISFEMELVQLKIALVNCYCLSDTAAS